MKIILVLCLSFWAISLFAQAVVVDKANLASKGITVHELNTRYGSESEIGNLVPLSLHNGIKNAFLGTLGEIKKRMYFSTTIFFNDSGKIDYLVYQVEPDMRVRVNEPVKPPLPKATLDSLHRILDSGLPKQLESFISKRHLGRKGQISTWVSLDVTHPDPKEVARQDSIMGKFLRETKGGESASVKRDSVVKTLEEALSISDSLKVKELFIEKALFETVPEVIYRFPNLEMLSLSDNDIERVDIDFGRLPKLRHLKLTGNILRNDQLTLSPNKCLKLLNLQANQLTDIPDAVRNCKKLETLWLGLNRMSGLNNDSFGRLRQLRDINFYKTELTAVPNGIRKLKRLQVLDLYHNKLTVLPRGITRLKRLTHLAVSNNQLSGLPVKLNRMKRVTTLYAHHNRLNKLPHTISKLKNLEVLDLGYNWFTELPAELTTFTKLKELDLSSNYFLEFPTQLLSIQRLGVLHLRGNPFLTEDREIRFSKEFGLMKSKNIEVFY